MINTLINDLKIFAQDNFHVETVSSYLKELNLSKKDLEKYDHRNKTTYTRNLIHREKDFEIMLVCWPPHVSAPIHGHEGEKCWARVQTGELKICNYVEINRDPLSLEKIQEFECTPGFLDGPADIHSVKNITSNFATTLHLYAKPYDVCDIYMNDLKTIQRVKLGYYSINGVKC